MSAYNGRAQPHPDDDVESEDARLTFDVFYSENYSSLLRTSYLLCGDLSDAEDILASAFMGLYKNWTEVQHPAAYTRRAIVNAHISQSRVRRLKTIRLVDVKDEPALLEDSAATEQLWDLLKRLGARQRAILVLRYYEGFDTCEIAHVLRCREGTVRSQQKRALDFLRKNLSEVFN